MPFNPAEKHVWLGATSITHVGAADLTNPGTGTNFAGGEPTGGTPAYARKAVTWAAAASEQRANSAAITLDIPAGTSVGFITYWNADTGNTGNYRGFVPINGSSVRGFAAVDTTLTNDQFLSPGHGLVNTDRVMLYNVFGGSLPTGTGLAEGALLHVVNATADTFKVSTTSGGAAIDLTAVGGGEVFFEKIIPEVFASQGQITIAIGALILDLTAV